MKIIFQILLFIFLSLSNLLAGESGDLPGQEIQTDNTEVEIPEPEEKEGLDVSSIDNLLEPKNNDVELPKNRLEKIFGQQFLFSLADTEIQVLEQCEKTLENGNCYVVDPKEKTSHFNNYFFYTNRDDQVYSIIVFNDKKQGDLNLCKNKILAWKNFFLDNYDLKEKKPTNNSLNFILTDAPQQNKLEIFASCYSETYRDVNSSFSIKFFKNT